MGWMVSCVCSPYRPGVRWWYPCSRLVNLLAALMGSWIQGRTVAIALTGGFDEATTMAVGEGLVTGWSGEVAVAFIDFG